MPRVKRGVTAHARHKKIIDQAKGYRGRRKNIFRVAIQAVTKAGIRPSVQKSAHVRTHPHAKVLTPIEVII